MANNILLVTHARFAEGIITSLRLIMGDSCPAKFVSVTTSETIPAIARRIEETLADFDDSLPAVVITDIPGGSTTQAALRVRAERPDVVFVTGLNMGLLLEISLLPLVPGDIAHNEELVRKAVDVSKQGIGLLNDLVPVDDGQIDGESDEL